MALAYLLDPTKQYQNVAGVNNVAGWLEVFISDTPERADVYVDFAGTRAPERIGIDNDGRAVMIVDSEGVYRVEMHAPNGDLLWTQYPIWPVSQGGGGAIGVDIGSSDGSIDVQRTQVGSVVNYDLSVAADGTDLLGWGEYVGYTMDGTHMVPSYNAGTIETSSHGILLQGGQYYHVTVTLGASSTEQNVYDAFQVSFKGVDGDGVVSTFATKSFHYDASTGEGHSYDVSFDMMPATDVELYAEATGAESGISVGIAEVYVHRVYSGAPFVPGTVADKDWVEDNFQEKLVAGQNIVIEDNVISALGTYTQEQADWAQTDSEAASYIKNKPDLSVYATQTDLTNGLATKQDVISDLATIRSGAALGATAVQDPNYVHTDNNFTNADATKLSGIEAGAEANVQANWNESDSSSDSFILNKPTIPSGSQLVPSATPSDAGEVLTVDSQGVPSWAPAQAPISAGNGIDITNNVVSVKVDGTTVTINGSGELEATATPQVQSDWTETDTTDPSYIQNKPIPKTLVAGSNITITEDSSTMTISADAAPQVQANWAETDTSDPSYIQNKPDLDTYATDAELTAGLATKQDVISDIADIRAGAQQGATAVQPSDLASALDPYATKQELNTGLAGKQNTIDDLTQIRQGASLGSTALQPGALDPYALTADVNTALADKQDTLTAGQNITITNNVISAAAAPQVQSNWSETDPSEVSYIQNKPDLSVYATNTALTNGLATKQDVISDLATIRSGASAGATAVQPGSLSTVATTGSYTDLTDKPTIPAQLSAGDGISITNNVVTAKVDGTSIDVNSSGELEVIGGSFTQEQADWAETDSSAVSYIENKPVPKTLVAGTNIVITEDSSTITVTATAEPQVNADWNANSGVAQILNKPDLSVYATNTALSNGLATKQNVISDLSTIRSGASAGATAVQPGDLATVATSGSYSDLSNKPTIPAAQVNSDWNASSGVAQILNKPTIPSGTQLVPAATSADADKVLTVNAQGTPAWASAQAPISAGNGINIANNVVSVDTSVVATQTDLAGKEDVFDVGIGLEMDTSGSTPTLQVEAPVDIVAGPGIVIDNPDGNTLRVSQAYPTDETVLYAGALPSFNNTITLSEPLSNFEYIDVSYNTTENPYITRYATALLGASRVAFKIGWGVNYMLDTWLKFTPTNDPKVWTYVNNTVMLFKNNDTSLTIIQNDTIYVTTSRTIRIVGIHRIAGGN